MRLITCMETLQGFKADDLVKESYGKGESKNMVALTTYIATASKGMQIQSAAGARTRKEHV